MTKIITRFAFSPTGKLHIGNVRVALVNWLYAKKYGEKFIFRIDDTDFLRSKDKYKRSILEDLKWLGLYWDSSFNQLSRLEKYKKAKNKLIFKGRLYPCYETLKELRDKRKLQLSQGKPPLYDRAALNLTPKQIAKYKKQARKPHYRFLLNDSAIIWDDLIKGEKKYQGSLLGDPVIIRADGSITYLLSSTIDDIDYNISHVIRGEDHVSNTAIQIQMFKALGAKPPIFGHLSLIKSKGDKISKRQGGFEISNLRKKENIEAMAINSFFALIGSSAPVIPYKNLQELTDNFDITTYSKNPITYIPAELELLNHKLVITYEFSDMQEYLRKNDLEQIDEKFWVTVRPNLQKVSDIKEWWQIFHNPLKVKDQEFDFLEFAARVLPMEISDFTWKKWTKIIAQNSGRKGKNLFMPLRIALTGKTSGPELKNLLPLLSRDKILERLKR